MTLRIRPEQHGVGLRLHDLEAAVMEAFWRRGGEALSVGDVVEWLARQDRPLAYTTVMTTLGRLHQKGLLRRDREGKRYLYQAVVTREALLEETARAVLSTAVPGVQAFAMLAERVADADVTELDALDALIQRRRRELGQ